MVARIRTPRTLRSQFLFALFAVGIAPLALAGALLIVLNQQALATQSSRELSGLARGIAAELELYVDSRLEDSSAIATLLTIDPDPAHRQSMLQAIFLHYANFRQLTAFDPQGAILLSSDPLLSRPPLDLAGLQAAARAGVQGWSVTQIAEGQNALLIYTPVRDDQREIVGVLESVVDLSKIQAVLGRIQVGGSGRAFVLDGQGHVLMHPLRDVMLSPDRYAWPGLTGGPLPAGPGTFFYEWERAPFVAAYYPINKLGWTAVVEQSEEELLGSVRLAGLVGVVGLLLSTLLTVAAGVVVVGRLVLPLRGLAEAARDFGAGDANTPIPTTLGQTRETAALITAFVEMRATVSEALRRERSERAVNDAILQSVPTGLMVVSSEQLVQVSNQALGRMLELPAPELAGRALPDLWPEPTLQREVGLALRGQPFRHQLLIEQADPQRLHRAFLAEVQTPDSAQARQLLVGIEDLTELMQVKLRYRALETLQAISQLILASADLSDLMPSILEHTLQVGGFDMGVIWLGATEGAALQVVAHRGLRAPRLLEQQPPSLEYAQLAVSTVSYDASDPIFAECAHLREEQIQSLLVVPIRRQDQALGLLELGARAPRSFSDVEHDLFDAVGSQIGLAVQKARLDEALRASEAETRMLALIASRTDNAAIITNSRAEVEWVNEGFTRITGYTLDEVRGHTPGSILQGPETNQEVVAYMRSQLRRGEGFRTEVLNYTKTGRKYWLSIEVQPIRDERGEVVKYMALESDISERKQFEQELRYQKALLESQSEASIDGILVVGPDRRWLMYNQRFLDLWHFSSARPPTTSDEALPQMMNMVADPAQFIVRIRDLYGRPSERAWDEIALSDGRYYERYTAPVTDRQGANYGRVWFYRDITARKRSEVALRDAKDEAERANRAKSEFLSRMSHELRTPLHAILGFAQVLDQEISGDSQRSSLAHILRAGQHLLGLINEVLDITRIEAGRMIFSTEPIGVREVVPEAIDLVRPLADSGGIAVWIEDGPPVFVRADRQRLKQVLVNLLSNAVKYNRPHGSVAVSYALVEGGMIRIEIRDTGFGIASDQLGRLFTPFDRLDADRKGVEGTGLGLALSKRLIEMMGGRIGANSTQGQGTRFWFDLPMVSEAPASVDPLQPHSAPAPASRPLEATILCIEDNLPSLKLVEHVLSRHAGVRLISSMVGLPTLDLARAHRPDLILLDINLPDVSGLTLLQQLQADQATRQIPVVVLSADATPTQLDLAIELGARVYLTKPLNIRRFSETIEAILHEREE